MTVVYDVTTFAGSVSPFTDVGKVINEIIANIKSQQTTQATRPGAVIYIPPGNYDLLTQVQIDISYLQIKGSGHGFYSQETRDHDSSFNIATNYDIYPGGSHVRVKVPSITSAFRIYRSGDFHQVGRINSVEFRDFCLDGVDVDRPYTGNPQRYGISSDSLTDSVRIEGMGFTRLHTAILMHGNDGTNVTNNFIVEVGVGIEMYGPDCTNPQITNNTIINPWDGASVLVDGGNNPYIADNFLDYWGNIRVKNCNDPTIRGNRINSWWPRSIWIDNSHDAFVADNHILRRDNRFDVPGPGLNDDAGIIYVNGDQNTVTNNLISLALSPGTTRPSNTTVAAIKIDGGTNNHLMMNRVTNGLGVPYTIVIASGVTNTRVIYSAPLARVADSGSGTQIVPTP